MVTIEQVERLLQYADISFEEARDALEAAGGNLLDAIVLLERKGKISSSGRSVRGANTAPDGSVRVMPENKREQETPKPDGDTQTDGFQRIGDFFEKGMRIMFIVYRQSDGWEIFRLPVLVMIILAIFAFWVTLPALLIGLLCGVRYRVEDGDVAVDKVNKVFDDVGEAADAVKNEVKRGFTGTPNTPPPTEPPVHSPASQHSKPANSEPVKVGPVQAEPISEPAAQKGGMAVDMPSVPDIPSVPEIVDVDFTPVELPETKPYNGPEQI